MDGISLTRVSYGTSSTITHLQSDGKLIVVTSSIWGFDVSRLNTNGKLDTTFGSSGAGSIQLPNSYPSAWPAYPKDIAIDSSGRIYVTGSIDRVSLGTSDPNVFLIRLTSTGSLDTTFDGDGRASIGSWIGASSSYDENGMDIALQADGKILVSANLPNGPVIFRFNSNGSQDTSFGSGFGTSSYIDLSNTHGGDGTSIRVLDDGQTIQQTSLGVSGGSGTFVIGTLPITGASTSNYDKSFGEISFIPTAIIHQSDGKIVVAGYSSSGGDHQFALARYLGNPEVISGNGPNKYHRLDTSFGTNGVVQTNLTALADRPVDLKIQSDGKIVVAGIGYVDSKSAFAVVRYNSNGSLDTSFSGDGVVITPVTGTSLSGTATSVDIQSDGKILVSGFADLSTSWTGNDALVTMRYTANGVLDSSYTSNSAPVGSLIISGTAAQGQTLIASNGFSDADGIGTVSYQWRVDGINFGTATHSPFFTLTQEHVGKAISVVATYTDLLGTAETLVSSATSLVANVNDLPSGAVTITGTAAQGQTLTATNTLADMDGLGAITYQWRADGVDLTGETGSTLTVTQAHVGKAITVAASYVDLFGRAEAVSSGATSLVANTNDLPTGTVTITGTAAQGQTLTVSNSLADIDGLGTITYQWRADGVNLAGATGNTLILTQTHVGKAITVVASYTDLFATAEGIASDATQLVAAGSSVTSAGDDILFGGSGIDVLNGLTGNDTFHAGNGNDWISGFDGIDTAVYSGTFASYTINKSTAGVLTISGPNGEGTDIILGVERLQFSDVTVGITNSGSVSTQLVNSTTSLRQTNPASVITYDTLGNPTGWTVLWQSEISNSNYENPEEIYAQRFTYTGAKSGSQTLINPSFTQGFNTSLITEQTDVAAATATNGSTFIAWTSDQQDASSTGVYGRIMSAGGTLGAEFRLNTTTTDTQASPSVAAVSSSSWVVAWIDFFGPNNAIKFSTHSSATRGSERTVFETTTSLQDVLVTSLSDSGWLISWQVSAGSASPYILSRKYDSSGNAGSFFTLSSGSSYVGDVGHDVAALSGGGWVATWVDVNSRQVYLQRFTADGVAQGASSVSSTLTSATGSYWEYSDYRPSIAALREGGWVVAWVVGSSGQGDVYLQRYLADGTKSGNAELVNVYTTGLQGAPDLLALPDGGWLVTWKSLAQDGSDFGIYSQRYDSNGFALTDSFTTDVVASSISYTLPIGSLNLTLTGEASINATGNALNNTLTGNAASNTLTGLAGNDTLDGAAGADTLIGGLGDDTYIVDNTGDTITENSSEGTDTAQSSVTYTIATNVENLTLTGSSTINATGNALNNTLTGNAASNTLTGLAGNDTLDGAAGADTLIGGLGDDTYIVDNTGDTITENSSEGTDTAQSSVTYTIATNVENLTLTGSSTINATGNALNNTLTGNAASNILDGAAGADTLIGGLGDDTYIVDNTGDTITENSSEGTDTVQSSVTYTIATNVENLTLTGSSTINATGNALNNTLTGNAASNTLTGLAGNDTLDGAAGADTLIGGLGDDTYIVDNTGDTITENSSEGTDTAQSSVTYTIATNVENLTLTGSSTINATGNALNNTLTGNAASNTLTGLAGNDTLDGAAGADTLIGGLGDDTYIVDNTGDTITENSSEGTDTAQSSVTYTIATNVENLTLTGSSTINATGNALNNTLTGNAASNILDGAAGADTLIGGLGDDTYIVDNTGDTITENSSEGTDTVISTTSYVLSDYVENIILASVSTALNAYGNELDNLLIGNNENNILDGGAGTDDMSGGFGDDTYYIDSINDIISEIEDAGNDTVVADFDYELTDSNLENLTLAGSSTINATGNALNNTLTGNAASNTLTGLAGNDTLDGAAGADTLIGGLGDDTYIVDNTGDTITENSSEGTDTAQSSVTYTIATNVENLTLTGSSTINATGNALNNTLTGNAASNILDGAAGADTLIGGLGDDTYIVDNTGDTITENSSEGTDTVQSSVTYTLAANVENLTLVDRFGVGSISATGNSLSNVIRGNATNNVIDGGSGIDTLIGGDGGDVYIVDNADDVVIEVVSEGLDTVHSYAGGYTLSEHVENITLMGSAFFAQGNDGANLIIGNELDNSLYGRGGHDEIFGLGGNDTLDGGSEANYLYGGFGDDIYVVRNLTTYIFEESDEGSDSVISWVSYTLADNFEDLYLEDNSSQAINGTGNAADNGLVGNSYNNILDGGAGADLLVGLGGDDIYILDDQSSLNTASNLVGIYGDLVVEDVNQGTDLVRASFSYALTDNVENLTLMGSSAINGTGNALANTITGNAGNNTLNGAAGADTLIGGLGDDTYVVDNIVDTITENSGAGTDTVQSSVTYTLANHVENLTLTGSNPINGTGNNLDNTLIGNADGNTLIGWAGNDILRGGYGGGDTLIGGFGNDVLVVEGDSNALTGGAGVDTFTFGDIEFTTNNRITDFELGDLIHFNGSVIAISSISEGSGASVAAGQVQYRISNGNTFLYVGTNLSPGADAIVTLEGFTNPQNLRVSNTLIGSHFNTLPTGANKTYTIPEANTQIIWARDFGFSDGDNGDSLAYVKITGLSSASGQYRLNNQAVAVNEVISVADIDAGQLTYFSSVYNAANPVAVMNFAVSDGIDYSGSYSLSFSTNQPVVQPTTPPISSITTSTTTTNNSTTTTTTVTFAATYQIPVSSIQSIGLSPDGQFLLIKMGGAVQSVATGSTMSFNGQAISTSDLTSSIAPIPVFKSTGGVGGFTLPELFTGAPELNLKYQLIETADNAVVIGSSDNDFIKVASANSVGKAVSGGGGDDVIDGGVGSTFISGGGALGNTDSSTYFLDGRAPGTSWSTITDFKLDVDKATIWGFVKGVSSVDTSFMNFNQEGATGYQGLTLHFKNLLPSGQTQGSNANLNSITFSGKTLADFGASSLAELNTQINNQTNPNFLVGATQDNLGTHGYLFIN
jgi:uncharacterized delta-60 repeat protein